MKQVGAAKSRQWRWAQKRIESGCCALCGKPRVTYAQRCDECAAKRRAKRGCKAWRRGSPGRPPQSQVQA
jgi:predicted amidophosphoribosyltransferase